MRPFLILLLASLITATTNAQLTPTSGNLTVGQHAFVRDSLQVDTSANIGQDLTVGRHAFVRDSLQVDVNTNIGQDLTVGRDAFVRDSLQVDVNTNIGQDLTVGRHAFVRDSLQVDVNTNIGQDLIVGRHAFVRDSLQVDVNTNIGQDLTVGRHAFVRDSLQVDVNTNIGQDLTVGRDAFVRDSLQVDVNTNIGQDLTVGRDAFVRDSLQVDVNTNIGRDLTVGRNAFVRDSLQVDVNTNIGQDLIVGRNAFVRDSLQVDVNTNIGQDLTVGRNAFVRDSLQVDMNTNIGRDLTVGRNATITDSLNAAALRVRLASDLQGELTVTNTARVDSLSVLRGGNIGLGLTVAGFTRLDTLDVSGRVTLGDSLLVGNSLIGSGFADIGSLAISSDTVSVSGGDLFVRNNLIAFEKLSVGTNEAFENAAFNVIDPSDRYEFLVFLENINEESLLTVNSKGQMEIQSTQTGGPDLFDNYGHQLFSPDQGVFVELEATADRTNSFLSLNDASGNQGHLTGAAGGGIAVATEHLQLFSPTEGMTINIEESAGSTVRYLTFRDTTGERGHIGGSPAGGVMLESSSGDVAEWLQRIDPAETMSFGDIVGVRGGRISKQLARAERYLVVSHSPILLGNRPEASRVDQYEMVGFMGQVPVKVAGPVRIGDYIIPSGRNDGQGVAVPAERMQLADYARIVGVAWEASEAEAEAEAEAVKLINTAIGINTNDLATVIARQQQELDDLKAAVAEIQKMLREKAARE